MKTSPKSKTGAFVYVFAFNSFLSGLAIVAVFKEPSKNITPREKTFHQKITESEQVSKQYNPQDVSLLIKQLETSQAATPSRKPIQKHSAQNTIIPIEFSRERYTSSIPKSQSMFDELKNHAKKFSQEQETARANEELRMDVKRISRDIEEMRLNQELRDERQRIWGNNETAPPFREICLP